MYIVDKVFIQAGGLACEVYVEVSCKKAKLQAGIKPTALCSAIDKENSMEFSLISLATYTLYYCGYALILPWSSCYSSHVTPCDVTIRHTNVTL